MSIATVSAFAAVLAAFVFTGCAATAPAASSRDGRGGETWTGSGGPRVVGGTARSVRDADLRASRERRTRGASSASREGGRVGTERMGTERVGAERVGAERVNAEPRRADGSESYALADGAALAAAIFLHLPYLHFSK